MVGSGGKEGTGPWVVMSGGYDYIIFEMGCILAITLHNFACFWLLLWMALLLGPGSNKWAIL